MRDLVLRVVESRVEGVRMVSERLGIWVFGSGWLWIRLLRRNYV